MTIPTDIIAGRTRAALKRWRVWRMSEGVFQKFRCLEILAIRNLDALEALDMLEVLSIPTYPIQPRLHQVSRKTIIRQ
jgi:hypothetical protein